LPAFSTATATTDARLGLVAQARSETAVDDRVDVGRVCPRRDRGIAGVGDLDIEAPGLARPHRQVKVRSRLADHPQGELDLTILGEGDARQHERNERADQRGHREPRAARRAR